MWKDSNLWYKLTRIKITEFKDVLGASSEIRFSSASIIRSQIRLPICYEGHLTDKSIVDIEDFPGINLKKTI